MCLRFLSLRVTLAVFASAIAQVAYANSVEVYNEEFSFRVHVPSHQPVCLARSGSHIHGIYYNLGKRKNCNLNNNFSSSRTIGLYASYNSEFFVSQEKNLPDNCEKIIGEIFDSKNIPNMIDGNRASWCVRRKSNSDIELYVSFQSKKWPEDSSSEAPHINYIASLHSNEIDISKDFCKFKIFLSHIYLEK